MKNKMLTKNENTTSAIPSKNDAIPLSISVSLLFLFCIHRNMNVYCIIPHLFRSFNTRVYSGFICGAEVTAIVVSYGRVTVGSCVMAVVVSGAVFGVPLFTFARSSNVTL